MTTPSSSGPPERAIRRGRLSTTPFSNMTNPTVHEPGAAVSSAIGGSSQALGGSSGIVGKSDGSATPGPLFHLTEHRAAVRGLAWSPHTRGLLASGGGRQDPIIRFWNTSLGYKIDQLQCHAQVCFFFSSIILGLLSAEAGCLPFILLRILTGYKSLMVSHDRRTTFHTWISPLRADKRGTTIHARNCHCMALSHSRTQYLLRRP